MRGQRGTAALLLALLVLGTACADEDLDALGLPDPPPSADMMVEDASGARLPINPSAVPYTPPPRALSPSWPDSTRLGVAEVDAAIEAVLTRDADRLFQLVAFHPEPCTRSNPGIGGPPQCRADEPEGTPHEVVLGMSCEGYWMPSAVARLAVEQLLAEPSALYAVYRPAGSRRAGNVAVVFEIETGIRTAHAWSVFLNGGQIVAIDAGCAASGPAYLDFRPATDFLLRPAA